MKLYIYETSTMKVIAIATGESNVECEEAARNYLGIDEYAGTYTPGFGLVDGLIPSPLRDIKMLKIHN